MQKLILLSIFLMVSQLSISQNSYPIEVKLGNDTVVCITYSQLKTINSEIELSEGKGEIIDSLDVALSLCDTSLSYYQAVVDNLSNQNSNLESQLDKYHKINLFCFTTRELFSFTRKKSREISFWTKVGSVASVSVITAFKHFLLL